MPSDKKPKKRIKKKVRTFEELAAEREKYRDEKPLFTLSITGFPQTINLAVSQWDAIKLIESAADGLERGSIDYVDAVMRMRGASKLLRKSIALWEEDRFSQPEDPAESPDISRP